MGQSGITHWVSLCMFPYSSVTLLNTSIPNNNLCSPDARPGSLFLPFSTLRKELCLIHGVSYLPNSDPIPGVGARGTDEGRSDQLQTFLLLSLLQA